jgi:hypothetical protein
MQITLWQYKNIVYKIKQINSEYANRINELEKDNKELKKENAPNRA